MLTTYCEAFAQSHVLNVQENCEEVYLNNSEKIGIVPAEKIEEHF